MYDSIWVDRIQEKQMFMQEIFVRSVRTVGTKCQPASYRCQQIGKNQASFEAALTVAIILDFT